MTTFKVFQFKDDQVCVRYDGYDDEANTENVVVSNWSRDKDNDLTLHEEWATFESEAAALEYVEEFSEMKAVKFLERRPK